MRWERRNRPHAGQQSISPRIRPARADRTGSNASGGNSRAVKKRGERKRKNTQYEGKQGEGRPGTEPKNKARDGTKKESKEHNGNIRRQSLKIELKQRGEVGK